MTPPRFSFRQTGQGPEDLILIHGIATNLAFWNLELVAALGQRFCVTTYDLRGHGYAPMPQTGYTPAIMAGDLNDLANHLGIKQAHVIGHSLGGTVALEFALQQPERVTSVTIADTRLKALQPEQALSTSPDWPAMRRSLAKLGIEIQDDDTEIGMTLLEGLASPGLDRARIVWKDRYAYLPFAGRTASSRMIKSWLKLLKSTTAKADLRQPSLLTPERIRRLTQPLLAIYGERSPNLTTCKKIAEAVPQCRVVIVPGSGHHHPASQPWFFHEALTGFIKGVAPPTPRT
jgi:pimeloyl-ACP methyl ester carboxylesterase